MAKLDPAALDDRPRELFEKLRVKARRLHEEDPYEVADGDW